MNKQQSTLINSLANADVTNETKINSNSANIDKWQREARQSRTAIQDKVTQIKSRCLKFNK